MGLRADDVAGLSAVLGRRADDVAGASAVLGRRADDVAGLSSDFLGIFVPRLCADLCSVKPAKNAPGNSSL